MKATFEFTMPGKQQHTEGELIDLLTQFDVTPEEARVYLLISSMNNLEASNIARMLSINRSTVYPILRSLDEKGLIKAQTAGVNRYRVLPIEPYLESRIKMASDRLRTLEGGRETLASAMSSMDGHEKVGETKFIEQKALLAHLIQRLIQGAEKDLFFYINNLRVRQMSEHFIKAIEGRKKSGVETRVLVSVNEKNSEYMGSFNEHALVRHTDANPVISFIVRDSEEAILIRPTPEIMDFDHFKDYAIWTDDRSLTCTFKCMLEKMWDVASDYQR